MSVLTYLTQAQIRDAAPTLEGEVFSEPRLLKTDGRSLTYAADVKVTGYDDPLRTVPIASANRDLIYADVGAAVTLTRTPAGRYEITAFSKRKPGRRVRIAVDLAGGLASDPVDVSLTVRRLTYDELATIGGGYGVCPYGAVGVFRAGVLIELRS